MYMYVEAVAFIRPSAAEKLHWILPSFTGCICVVSSPSNVCLVRCMHILPCPPMVRQLMSQGYHPLFKPRPPPYVCNVVSQ